MCMIRQSLVSLYGIKLNTELNQVRFGNITTLYIALQDKYIPQRRKVFAGRKVKRFSGPKKFEVAEMSNFDTF